LLLALLRYGSGYEWKGDDSMMQLAVFAMLCAFILAVYAIGSLSTSKKTTNSEDAKTSGQPNASMMENAEKPRSMAAGGSKRIIAT
jgi:hypothetical protein